MSTTSQDEDSALKFAERVGFRVLADGFVQSTRAMDDVRGMLMEFYRLAQAELLDDDGK